MQMTFPPYPCLPCGSVGTALGSGSGNPSLRCSGTQIALLVGMAGGLWQGLPEGQIKQVSGSVGQTSPVIRACKTLDLNSVRQWELCNWTVEVRAAQQNKPSAGPGIANPSIQNI